MDWNNAGKCITIGVAISVLCCSVSCRRQPAPPGQTKAAVLSPPDLTNCTRMETRFVKPIMDVYSFSWGKQDVLSADDLAHIQSLELFIVDKEQRIEVIAHRMSKAKHLITRRSENVYGVPALRDVAQVTCFRGDTELASFMLKERGALCTRDGEWFEYNDTGLDLSDFAPQVRPFAARCACAHNMHELRDGAPTSVEMRDTRVYTGNRCFESRYSGGEQ